MIIFLFFIQICIPLNRWLYNPSSTFLRVSVYSPSVFPLYFWHNPTEEKKVGAGLEDLLSFFKGEYFGKILKRKGKKTSAIASRIKTISSALNIIARDRGEESEELK